MLTDPKTRATITVPTQVREMLAKRRHRGGPSEEDFQWLMILVIPEKTITLQLLDLFNHFQNSLSQVISHPV